MKKNILFLLFSIPIFLLGIEISGEQSGSWDAVDNPHLLVGDVTVPAGEELIVNPGVELIAQGNYRITVEGIIQVQGTVTDSVKLYGAGGSFWGGIRLESESGINMVNYCRISNTNDDNDYAVHAVSSGVMIENCVFNDHKKAVGFSGLSTDFPPEMHIRKSKIYDCEYNGIIVTDNSNVIVDSCEITFCGTGTQYRGAIQLALQTSAHSCSPQISNNWIHDNGKQGIIMGNIFNYSGMSPEVLNNTIEYNLTGIYLFNAEGFYRNNQILNNYELNNPNSGAGIMLWGSGADGIFTGNELSGNFTGVYLGDGATANFGDVFNASILDDGGNYIHDNVDQSGNLYSIYNISTQDVMAQNNVWDSFDPGEIANTIYDGLDLPGYGIVNFEPLMELDFPMVDGLDYQIFDNYVELNWEEPEFSFPLVLEYYEVYLDGNLITETTDLFYLLEELVNGQTYQVGVISIYNLGVSPTASLEFIYTGTGFTGQELPAVVNLKIAPNPFREETIISYQLLDPCNKNSETEKTVNLKIYNLKGQLIRTLIEKTELTLGQTLIWDGRDSQNRKLVSGIYFCRLSIGDKLFFRKINLIK